MSTLLTRSQQFALDAAVNFTCNKIGSPSDESNYYQEAVDAMDKLCGEMDDLQFDEFSLRLFLQENVQILGNLKSGLEKLKSLYSTSPARGTTADSTAVPTAVPTVNQALPPLNRHDALVIAMSDLIHVRDDLRLGSRSLGNFVTDNHKTQVATLEMIDKLSDLLSLSQFHTLPASVQH